MRIAQLPGPYINDPGYEVPDNTLLIVPHSFEDTSKYKDILFSLKGETKRDWFTSHFYYCLPLNIGNQYGYVIKSLRDFDVTWSGGLSQAEITFTDGLDGAPQVISNGFGSGIITVQNYFAIKSPIGVNVMVTQPPNMFIPGLMAMTAVIETDQIRRDFTFNLKVTIPDYKISVKRGDAVGAFIPIPRYFVDKFEVASIKDVFPDELHLNEISESNALGHERNTNDLSKPHASGRRYFNGKHVDDSPYPDHQKRVR